MNTYDGAVFSNSKEESKKEGYFVTDLIPNQDSIQLSNRKIKSPDLWIELAQESDHFLIFFSLKKAVQNQYNIIMAIEGSCDNKEYLFDLKENYQVLNCIKDLGFIYKVPNYNNSLKIYVKQGSPDFGWQKEMITDSLIYKEP